MIKTNYIFSTSMVLWLNETSGIIASYRCQVESFFLGVSMLPWCGDYLFYNPLINFSSQMHLDHSLHIFLIFLCFLVWNCLEITQIACVV